VASMTPARRESQPVGQHRVVGGDGPIRSRGWGGVRSNSRGVRIEEHQGVLLDADPDSPSGEHLGGQHLVSAQADAVVFVDGARPAAARSGLHGDGGEQCGDSAEPPFDQSA
jgi:hypothetical protein